MTENREALELKACPKPWCNGCSKIAKVWHTPRGSDGLTTGYHAECLICGLDGPIADTVEEAARLWNTRTALAADPPPHDLMSLIKVREALERIHRKQLNHANVAFEEGDQGSAILIKYRADGVKLALDTLFPPDDGEDTDEPYGDNIDTKLQGWEGT